MKEMIINISDIPSSNRGIQRQRWQIESGGTFDRDQRGKRREGEGDGASGSHHSTSTFGLSSRQHLLQMQAHVDVQDRAMRVPQGRSRLRVMPMSGAVCQRRTPDPTGQDAEHGGNNREGETQEAAGESEGGTADAIDTTVLTGEGGDGDMRWKSGQKHDDTFGGRRKSGGRSRIHPKPVGSTSLGSL